MVVGVIVTFWLVLLVLEIFISCLVRLALSVDGSLDEGNEFFMASFCRRGLLVFVFLPAKSFGLHVASQMPRKWKSKSYPILIKGSNS
jgi:hypothetical protein